MNEAFSTLSCINNPTLTGHVTTRWYRAPEIVLMETTYGSAMDMWGIGCIFAELLQMLSLNKSLFGLRMPLFPGTSCYPLSPSIEVGECLIDNQPPMGDQLETICSVLGNPTEADLKFLTSLKARQFLKQMKHYEGAKFKSRFPFASLKAIDILGKMLNFNPNTRITAKDALNHPYFKEVRCVHKEVKGILKTKITELSENYIEKLLSVINKTAM